MTICPHSMQAKDRNGETYCCDCGKVTKKEAAEMKIIVNGVEHNVPGTSLTHEDICRIAGEPVSASVMYSGPRHGDSQRSGTTHKGKSVEIEDGMSFDCVVTGNA